MRIKSLEERLELYLKNMKGAIIDIPFTKEDSIYLYKLLKVGFIKHLKNYKTIADETITDYFKVKLDMLEEEYQEAIYKVLKINRPKK